MTTKTKAGDRFVEAMLAGLSAAGIKRQIMSEYIAGFPFASDAQLQMLVDAEAKAGGPPHDLNHAALILADNIFAFRPVRGSPFDRSRNYWPAFHYWKPSGEPRSL
jgi:hypothetical protein